MTSNSHRLRLGPLPRTESIKLTVSLPAELKTCLDDYAAAHSRVHGEAVDAATLIPHMLQLFIARDRGFKALRSRRDDNGLPRSGVT
jgi:hypothetical protein